MTTILLFLAIFGLAFLVKQSDGPWGVMNWLRRTLLQNKHVGVFFFNLMECWFCVGCHAGWIVYLLGHDVWQWQWFIIWTLAGGTVSLMMGSLLERLHRE
jgi:hypothetical protein